MLARNVDAAWLPMRVVPFHGEWCTLNNRLLYAFDQAVAEGHARGTPVENGDVWVVEEKKRDCGFNGA